jgi:precorrin-6Y C5,15-methyltransferase (decarboxylating)
MFDLCIFAGTTEGRQLIEFLSDTGLSVYVCVATQYGEALVPRSGNITVSAGRLSQPALEALFSENRFGLVIDATHPYASQATLNISTACSAAGVEYLRLNREVQSHSPGAVYVGSVAEAAAYLNETRGNVLVTTGSKELPAYTRIDDYRRRLYVRVLPAAASIQACEQAGFDPSHIIAMQGPFSKELNKALIRSVNAAFIVSKDAGNNGGFFEKTEAACDEGVVHVIIGRPPQLEGLTLEETIHALCARYGIEKRRQISVIGVGTGAPALLTEEAKNALRTCDCVIGAKRAVEAAAKNKHSYITLDPMKILAFIKAHPEYIRIAVVMSGDTGFYSGAKKLLPALKDFAPNILPGISSLQYFCAKLSLSWDDVHVLSLHGRSGSAARAVRQHKKVFVLVGCSGAIRRHCRESTQAGLGGASVSVGERLSYEDEKITTARLWSSARFRLIL